MGFFENIQNNFSKNISENKNLQNTADKNKNLQNNKQIIVFGQTENNIADVGYDVVSRYSVPKPPAKPTPQQSVVPEPVMKYAVPRPTESVTPSNNQNVSQLINPWKGWNSYPIIKTIGDGFNKIFNNK